MFFTLILENQSGEQLNLSTTANQYMTSKIEGLNPPAGTVSTSSYAGMNGSYLNNAFIEKRNVVISFAMRGIGIEKRRHQLYHVVTPSRYIKIWYKTANIDVSHRLALGKCCRGADRHSNFLFKILIAA